MTDATWPPDADARLRAYLSRPGYKIPAGLDSKEATCSLAAIRLAWDGVLSDDPPPCSLLRKLVGERGKSHRHQRRCRHPRRVSDLRRRELAAIHIRKREVGLSEEDYRALLQDVGQVSSARDLDGAGRQEVLQRLAPRPTAPRRRSVSFRKSADPMVRKIYALLGARPAAYAVGIMRQMFGAAAPDAIEWATGEQMRKVIQALEYDRQRKAR